MNSPKVVAINKEVILEQPKAGEVTVDMLEKLLAKAVNKTNKRNALYGFLRAVENIDNESAANITFDVLIKRTYNYKLFKKIRGNRTIKIKKVKKLVNSIDGGLNLLPYCPVLVNEKLEICDGQHRFETAKTNGEPIYYIVCDSMTVKQIAEMNSNSDSWTVFDFLECYVALGIPDYIYLKDFCEKTGYGPSVAVYEFHCRYFTSYSSSETMTKFKSGDIKLNQQQKDYAKKLAVYIEDFKEYDEKIAKDRNFVRAVGKLTKLEEDEKIYDHKRMMQKVKSHSKTFFELQPTTAEYLRMLEKMYNYRVHKVEDKQRLFFDF